MDSPGPHAPSPAAMGTARGGAEKRDGPDPRGVSGARRGHCSRPGEGTRTCVWAEVARPRPGEPRRCPGGSLGRGGFAQGRMLRPEPARPARGCLPSPGRAERISGDRWQRPQILPGNPLATCLCSLNSASTLLSLFLPLLWLFGSRLQFQAVSFFPGLPFVSFIGKQSYR